MWKKRVNELLTKTTGYRLERARPASRRKRRRRAARPRRPPEPAGRVHLRHDYDDPAKEIITRVRDRTMTSAVKLFGLIESVRYVVRYDVPGDIVECGVWRGGSMQAVALTLLEVGATGRELHLFDTFEGMPPPTDKDRRHDGRLASDLLAAHDRDAKIWAVATIDDVRSGMDETRYPPDRIHYHPGRVEQTIPDEAPERIALLRLDTDWYESTRHELEHLYHRLSPGGVLIIDDYGHFDGARLAVDEFVEKIGEPLLLLPLSFGRIAVKPAR
jgi:O-methyltransferase